MHELSIATAIVDRAAEVAREHGAAGVSSVTVRLGELAGVVPDALTFSFEVAREGTALATAALVVETVTARAYCEPCAAEFPVGMPPLFWCPRCEQPSTALRGGRELEVVRVELREDAGPAAHRR
ncbi:hydrogenase maturation nickel metallochaperone HypA [Streptomyces sp. NRRL F-5135]|uniref:hydrogenase maturation nickel metallochaperone HypA n=1 Tax=Streptomyces sp. NRRL F-5135 TaxID=1463858 RepID=UPI0004C893BB|nr:hydrogenase maturation nickel metallochaperone HypA [Streptomyces sp. NRRL F-5135]